MSTWEATVEAINALPDPVRRYIFQLETRCDPSGEVRYNMQLLDVQRELISSNRMLRDSLDGCAQQVANMQLELRNRS